MKTIKMFALLITLLLVLTLQARAQSATSFDYTGSTADNIDYLWFPGFPLFGGPGGDDLGGGAEQFTISQPTNISSLNVTAFMDPINSGAVTFNYDIYNQSTYEIFGTIGSSPVPYGGIIAQSDPISFTLTQAEYNAGIDVTANGQVPFNVDLQPGTYWLAEIGGGGPYTTTSQTYNSVVPEPPTLILFMIGLALLLSMNLSLRRSTQI